MENCRYRKCVICGIRKLPKSSILLASFPLHPDRCRLWVKASGIEDLVHVPIEKLHELKYVCGSHFAPECFNAKGNRLLSSAVPTLRLNRPLLSDDLFAEFPLHVKSYYAKFKKEIQATASTSSEFPKQCLPEYTQSSQDAEVVTSSSCDFQTLPQVLQNLQTTQNSQTQDSEVIPSSLCETNQKVIVEALPQVTQNLPVNPDSEIQATTFTSGVIPENTQCSQDSEIQATAFTSGVIPEYTQCSQDSEFQVIGFSSGEIPEYTQSSEDPEIQATAFTFNEFPEQCLPEFTPSSQDSEFQVIGYTYSQGFPDLCLPEYTQSGLDSEIQAFVFTSSEDFPEQCLPEYTQISQDSEYQVIGFTSGEIPEYTQCSQESELVKENMINSDDQSIDGGFLFKVSDVEACRICLATNVKLFSLQDTHLGNCMKSIGGFSTSSCGGLPNFVCYECAPTLLKCAKLIEKSKTAEALLLSIVANNGLITKTLIEQEKTSQSDLQSSLDSYLLLNYYYIKYDDDNRTSEYIQTEPDPPIEMETDNSGIVKEVGAHEMAEDNNSVVEVGANEMAEDNNSVVEVGTNEIAEDNNSVVEVGTNEIAEDNNSVVEVGANEIAEDNISVVEVSANEIADQDDSVVEIEPEIPVVEIDSSDGESNEEYISLVPHKTNEILEKCAKRISSQFQRKPRWTKQRKNIRLYRMKEFLDISQHFTTTKIPVKEQKQAWRDNMVMKCIETGREFICSVCQRTFQTEDLLNKHSQYHASNPGGVRCGVCLVGFPDEAALWDHTERIHAYRFNCKRCPMLLNNVDDAKYHKTFVCNGSGINRPRRLNPQS